jgi:MSHA pilin protein MshC
MNSKGFTLIELIMVIVLIGIIIVVVSPKLGDVTDTKAAALADKLRADIRYAQNLAMTTSQRHRVYINTAPGPTPDGYSVVNVATGLVVQDPAGGNLSVVLNAGDYAGITVSPNAVIEFNSLGSPTTGGTNLTAGGTTITVTAETGAVN